MARLTFTVTSKTRPYAVMVLFNGLVTVRMGPQVLRNTFLAHALQWVREHNPHPELEPRVTLAGRF